MATTNNMNINWLEKETAENLVMDTHAISSITEILIQNSTYMSEVKQKIGFSGMAAKLFHLFLLNNHLIQINT